MQRYVMVSIDGKKAGVINWMTFNDEELERVAYPDHVVKAQNIATRRMKTFRGPAVGGPKSKRTNRSLR